MWSPRPRTLDPFGLLPCCHRPLSSHPLVALGTVTWNCWALLKVVQGLVSTHSEMRIPVGLGAKHCHCPQPSPTCQEGGRCRLQDSPGPRHTDLPIGLWASVEWPLTDDHLLKGQCSDPGSAALLERAVGIPSPPWGHVSPQAFQRWKRPTVRSGWSLWSLILVVFSL